MFPLKSQNTKLRILAATSGLLLLPGGCVENNAIRTSGTDESSATFAADTKPADFLLCGNHRIPRDRVENPRRASQLGATGMEAIKAEDVPNVEDSRDWIVIAESPDLVSLLQEPSRLGKGSKTAQYQLVVIEKNRPPEKWRLTSSTRCELRRYFDGIEPVHLFLDPDMPPKPGDKSVQLLVREIGCASGKTADGRVKVVALEVTPDEVGVAIGVVPSTGAQECPGNPTTHYTLELPEALSQRQLIDIATYPKRPIPVAEQR